VKLVLTAKMPRIQIKTPKDTRGGTETTLLSANTSSARSKRSPDSTAAPKSIRPVFELKSILTEYGEDDRLIYNLQDQGGELCALRYDLTVTFTCWLAMKSVHQVKAFRIGKVYRRDQPAISQGRMREFFQCDFDIAGAFDSTVTYAEIISIAAEVFEALNLGVTIRINNRLILDGILKAAGVPEEKVRPISSAVEKLDKLPLADGKKEMIEKNLAPDVADRLGTYVARADTNRALLETLEVLWSDDMLSSNEDVKKGIAEMEGLYRLLSKSDVTRYVKFDLSLARGLNYYTGLVYEVVPIDTSLKIGSIAARDRYDRLVGNFSKRDIPCVGISFGIDRILALLRGYSSKPNSRVDVWMAACGGGLLVDEKIAVARQLRKSGISVDFDSKADEKLRRQLDAAESNGANVAVVLGDDATSPGNVQFKILKLPDKTV
jgi:histidyl-tRNA synthetase